MIIYLDTSAVLKLLVQEAESDALAAWLDEHAGDDLVASFLLHTELHCAADRRRELDPTAVSEVLDGIELIDLLRDDLERAASSGWRLRSADAIHLASALRVRADVIVVFDHELAEAAERAGIRAASPGAPGG